MGVSATLGLMAAAVVEQLLVLLLLREETQPTVLEGVVVVAVARELCVSESSGLTRYTGRASR